jgi:pyrimidine-nucleoside phosphorylase
MTSSPSMVDLIQRKKRGEAHGADELGWICERYLAGEIPDYQVAAWLMAVRWRGMTAEETLALTSSLVASGQTLEWRTDRPVVDKHSTGGVGDKTSIALVPLLAAAGLVFVKMSGRGLGHTGGTIDKLESIPGFETDFSLDRLQRQVERIGCALVGQSRDLAPADGALYALRDVTATVDSLPLIASSVMSKKLAAGAGAIILDVKFGAGAFIGGEVEAKELALAMIAIGEGAGRRVGAVLSSMDVPLGRAVGNALEVAEAIELLHGGGSADLRELTLLLGARLMALAGAEPDVDEARSTLARLLESGAAADKLAQLVEAQGGDASVVEDPGRLPHAPHVEMVRSPRSSWVRSVDARSIAEAALALGAGRRRKGDEVDPRTGVRLLARSGEHVAAGEPFAEIHAASAASARPAAALVERAYRWSEDKVEVPCARHTALEEA